MLYLSRPHEVAAERFVKRDNSQCPGNELTLLAPGSVQRRIHLSLKDLHPIFICLSMPDKIDLCDDVGIHHNRHNRMSFVNVDA
jgi:hypothetical protein